MSADRGQLIAEAEALLKQSDCEHIKRAGGNDYLLCDDCGLMWDYRRERPEQRAQIDFYAASHALVRRLLDALKEKP